MRKTFFIGSLAVALWALCLAALPAWAVDRCVLAELMTWVKCTPCPRAEGALDSLTEEYPNSSLAIIRQHPQSNDPFYQIESKERLIYYHGGPWVIFPTTFFDGVIEIEGAESESTAYSEYKSAIETRLSIPSPLSMDVSVTYDTLSRSGQASVEVVAHDSLGEVDLHLRHVLIESGLIYNEVLYNEVLRDMYPDQDGVSFTVGQGETFRDTVDFTLDPQWLPENCDLVAFVQDDATKEVLQSIQTRIPLAQLPEAVADLEVLLCDSQLFLTWSPVTKDQNGHPLVVDYYRIFRDTSRYFGFGVKTFLDSTAELSYLDTSCHGVDDTLKNCSYYVKAVAGDLESAPSRVVGEVDKYIFRVK